MLQICFVVASERPQHQHNDGRSVLVSAVGIRNYRKVTNLENMTHEADKSSLTDNALCGLVFSCRRNQFPVVHNSRRRRQMLQLKQCITLIVNIVVCGWKQSRQDASALSATHSVSELPGHRRYI
jgi:hypothetical protein